jgi:hypothetical protein
VVSRHTETRQPPGNGSIPIPVIFQIIVILTYTQKCKWLYSIITMSMFAKEKKVLILTNTRNIEGFRKSTSLVSKMSFKKNQVCFR